jgi:hypothetical protein
MAADFARRLVAVLLEDGTYAVHSPPFSRSVVSGCSFDPGIGYRLWSGKRSVDVLFCFECDQVEIGPIPRRLGDLRWEVADTHARAVLLGLAKEALPDAPEITALPAVRPR